MVWFVYVKTAVRAIAKELVGSFGIRQHKRAKVKFCHLDFRDIAATSAFEVHINNSSEVRTFMIQPIVWVHGDCLSPQNPALQEYPDASLLSMNAC